MKDTLIPLGGLIFICLLAYAMISAGRKQRKAKSGVFRDFAEKNDLRYQQEDDGKAQGFAHDLDGIGQFKSPSLGLVIPKDVVSGIIRESEAIFFRHYTRYGEGWAMEWFVSGLIRAATLAERCAVQFCKGKWDKDTMYLQDHIVKEQKAGPFNMIVRATNTSFAGKIMDDDVLKKLAGLAGNLSFRPEIQIRGKRIAAYLADRNATVEDLETLEKLFEFTKNATKVLEQTDAP